MSKKISAERRTGFLDNITARVDEDNKKKEMKKGSRRSGSSHVTLSEIGRRGKEEKRKRNASVPQVDISSPHSSR